MMWGWWWWWWMVIHHKGVWLTERLVVVVVVILMGACFAFFIWICDRSLHGFATEGHSMWKFHSSFCHGCEIPYRSSCHGSCFHCCWTQRRSLARCYCSGSIPLLSLSFSFLLPQNTTNTILLKLIKAPNWSNFRLQCPWSAPLFPQEKKKKKIQLLWK